ncbi:MAG TPA: hypothetical protein VLA13_08790 [Massilibacterium sp.]|nr:hypothetical protein [Massilibacterium sp.]
MKSIFKKMNDISKMTCSDYSKGQVLIDMWFGKFETFEVIGFDVESNQVQVKHISTGGLGSYYDEPYKFEISRIVSPDTECYYRLRNLYHQRYKS